MKLRTGALRTSANSRQALRPFGYAYHTKLPPLPAYAGTGYEMRGQAAGAYPSVTLPPSQKLRRASRTGLVRNRQDKLSLAQGFGEFRTGPSTSLRVKKRISELEIRE